MLETNFKHLLLGTAFCFGLGCAAVGGPVDGPADAHCGSTVVTVDQAECNATPESDGNDFGDTHDGTEADDDDCKYHVKWSSTAVEENKDVTFTVTLTAKKDSSAVGGAKPSAEVFLTDTHPAPNTSQASSESPAGTYKIGPIRFDQKGDWTVRFHFFETCADTDASPHGHAAFFVSVP